MRKYYFGDIFHLCPLRLITFLIKGKVVALDISVNICMIYVNLSWIFIFVAIYVYVHHTTEYIKQN